MAPGRLSRTFSERSARDFAGGFAKPFRATSGPFPGQFLARHDQIPLSVILRAPKTAGDIRRCQVTTSDAGSPADAGRHQGTTGDARRLLETPRTPEDARRRQETPGDAADAGRCQVVTIMQLGALAHFCCRGPAWRHLCGKNQTKSLARRLQRGKLAAGGRDLEGFHPIYIVLGSCI